MYNYLQYKIIINTLILPVFILSLPILCNAEQINTPKVTAKQPAISTQKNSTKSSIKKSPKRQTTTELELCGLSNETSNQFSTRINYNTKLNNHAFTLKGGCNLSKSYTYSSKNKVYTTQTNTYTLDLQYRVNNPNDYRFLIGNLNTKDKTPQNSSTKTTGFYLIGGGVGRSILKGLDCEIGLATVHSYDQAIDKPLTPFSSMKLKHNVNDSIAIDANILLIRPFESDTLIDSSANLTYKLNSDIGLRLTYIAHNLQNSSNAYNGWDRSLRFSLLFRNISK